ncbi:MAG: SDR family oxidoreductase, partial [Mesorhizobium sp.]
NGRVSRVSWAQGEDQGTIETDIVVNCAGMWARELGRQNGVTIPLHACEHFYLVTEPIPGLSRLPVLRVPDECAYYKEDAGKMMLGAFEPVAKPWGMDGIREDFCFDQLPEDMDHFEPILEMGVNRMPMLGTAGIHTFFNGPESFTPDDRYYLGEAPELAGYWMATGYNSIGIVSSGGAGMALAQWINDGEAPFDLWEVDIRRAQPFQKNRRYLKERVSETLGLLYADHFPYRQMATSRGVRRSPLHEHLKARGAVFGEVAGWERANWFAREGQEREYRYSWKRQNWFDNQREEHLAVRNGVGLFDMTSFGKIRVEGRDACAFLQRLCANDMDVAPGRIVYTQMLNAKGGIESDLTVTRLSETAYFLVVAGATLQRDLAWLRKHVADEFVVITDMTAAEAVICVMGPEARKLIQKVSPNDFSNEVNPFGTFQEIEIGMGLARAHRVTYVGELGWELYVSTEQAAHVFEAIAEAGADVACFGHASNGGLEQTADKIKALGRKALALAGSVTSETDLTAAIDRVEAELGALTVAVNNAGIAGSEAAETMPLEKWRKVHEVNVAGVFLSCQAEASVMLPRRAGSIINIASMSGTIVNRGLTQAHYNSSKAAVIHMSKSLAMEWADRGLRVNVVSPGYTLTPMNKRPEVAEEIKIFKRDTPMGRMAAPEEMVGPTVFLASRASSFVTGLDLIVDGGYVCW